MNPRLAEKERIQDDHHETFSDAVMTRPAAYSSPAGEARRHASPELVRRVVLEAASAWPELGEPFTIGLDTAGNGTAVSVSRPGQLLGLERVRRDTLAGLREDAAALASKAAAAVRAVPPPCPECVRLGPPQSATAHCSTCGARGIEAGGVGGPSMVEDKRARFGTGPLVGYDPGPTRRTELRFCWDEVPGTPEHSRRTGLDVEREIAERTAALAEARDLQRFAAADEVRALATASGIAGEVCQPGCRGFCRTCTTRRGTYGHETGAEYVARIEAQDRKRANAESVRALAGETGPEYVARLNAEALPAGWTWDATSGLPRALAAACLAQITSTGKRFSVGRGEIPPAVWSAVEARARRLGLIADGFDHRAWGELGISEPAPKSYAGMLEHLTNAGTMTADERSRLL